MDLDYLALTQASMFGHPPEIGPVISHGNAYRWAGWERGGTERCGQSLGDGFSIWLIARFKFKQDGSERRHIFAQARRGTAIEGRTDGASTTECFFADFVGEIQQDRLRAVRDPSHFS
jgi:hypothetical protein